MNTKAVWGERSAQYAASKQIAESVLKASGVNMGGDDTQHDDIAAKLEALMLR